MNLSRTIQRGCVCAAKKKKRQENEKKKFCTFILNRKKHAILREIYEILNVNYFLLRAKIEASFKQCNYCLEKTKTYINRRNSLPKSVFSVVAKKVSVICSLEFFIAISL